MRAAAIRKNSDKQRLRLVLLLFLLALGIPTLVLIEQAYSQLKWEAFHQHRLLAEELGARIDRRLNELIAAEEARAFTDYTFLVVTGDPAANFLQRSPLSAHPPAAVIPGMLGYFQIDADEVFSTPLLPPSDAEASAYGIDARQLKERKALQAQIRRILSENRLVQKKKSKPDAVEEITPAAGLTARHDQEVEKEQRQRLFDSYDMAGSTAAPAAQAPAAPADESYFSSGSLEQPAESIDTKLADDAREQEPAQAAFDRLSEADSKGEHAAGKKSAGLQVENVELSNAYEQKTKSNSKLLMKNAPEIPQRAPRKERSVLPEPVAAKPPGSGTAGPQAREAVKINIFESELDPFEISLLDSGHFILFRKVWRNDRRYIQGALLEQQAFINGIIETLFRETALSQSSGLTVAYGGEVLASFDCSDMRNYRDSGELGGALLYRTHLSAPFTGLELIFNLSYLPAGPGGKVVGWVAVIIVLVLCGGTWLMYRLGLRQLALVNQQQDFVSAVSHELKTPLTSIRMYGEMLKQGWVDENKKKTYYEFIFDESERLTRLINNVLQLARMTRNDFEINPKTVKIGELLDTVRSKISTQIERAGFVLHMQCEETARAASIEVDVDIFTQIIINLIDNALKFSARAATRAVDIEAGLQDHATAVFSVRDYGPGIPKNQMTRIFRLFYRSGNELTRETAGTGIGLALVRQLSQAMRGQVDVLNREPGAEFRLVFPVSSAPDAAVKA
jgi:signal transduction histidine kinase